MSATLTIDLLPLSASPKGVLILFCDDQLKFGSAARELLEPSGDLIKRAAEAAQFKGKHGSTLELIAPAGLRVPRLVVVGVGKTKELKTELWLKLGGVAMGKIANAAEATIVAELPGDAVKPDQVADLVLGIRLRAYSFDRYKTKRKDEEQPPSRVKIGDRGRKRRAGAEGPSRRATRSPRAW